MKKSEETQLRVKKRKEEGPRKHRRNKDYFYEPTQEEKLAEAMVTEEENLKSLGTNFDTLVLCPSNNIVCSFFYCVLVLSLVSEKYQKMELEKKKTRGVKRGITGPTIRYLSVAMPDLEEFSSNGLVSEEKINVDDTTDE